MDRSSARLPCAEYGGCLGDSRLPEGDLFTCGLCVCSSLMLICAPGEMTTCIYPSCNRRHFYKGRSFKGHTHYFYVWVWGFTMQWYLGLRAMEWYSIKGDCILINFIQILRTEFKSRIDLQSTAFFLQALHKQCMFLTF